MLKEEPSAKGDRNRKQNLQKSEQGGYPENIKDPRILAPQRDYTDFGYNPEAKAKENKTKMESNQEQHEPSLPVTDPTAEADVI